MSLRRPLAALLAALALCLAACPAARADLIEDAYIRGYAESILRREVLLSPRLVRVEEGVVTVDAGGLGEFERRRLRDAMETIPNVAGVVMIYDRQPLPPSFDAPATRPATDGRRRSSNAVISPARLFDPLLADPRWPHLFASYQRYTNNDTLENVGSVGFGETLAFVHRDLGDGRRLELGLQAGVFAIFDFDAASTDLVNADYLVGSTLAYRGGDLSALFRVYHQSSHLGDEFILNNTVNRRDLSVEIVSLIVSYEFADAFRVYGGGSYIYFTTTEELRRGEVQIGAEYVSPVTVAGGYLRPIVAADLKWREETEWDTNFSLRTGVELGDPNRFDSRLQLLLEYFDGNSPNGQFFNERLQYVGIGLHFYF